MRSVDIMAERWRKEGLVLLPAESESAVRESFAKVESIATLDVISMYAVLGGMEEMDREYWRLWPLSELVTQNSEKSQHGILFSDYLADCWSYRLVPNADDTSSVYVDYFDSKRPILVAGSIDEFFRTYALDPFRLLEGPYPRASTDGDA